MADNTEEVNLVENEQEEVQDEEQMEEEELLQETEPAETEEAVILTEESSIVNNEADISIALDTTVEESGTGDEAQEPKEENEQQQTENEEMADAEEANEDANTSEAKEEDGKDLGDEDDDEEDDDEELEEDKNDTKFDPNVMPQVNVAVLAKRRWQVKVYPLKPADFTSGLIARVFKSARESLLYLMHGKNPRGKGEMYIQSVTESMRVVRSLMTLDSHFPDINIEVIRKNNEGVILEKAYMRFDTKMVRMLFVNMPPVPPRAQGRLWGRKRERVIGSVFVKNLPPGTTKNMLRVMFPFAQEINYNPEKYTDGTARLVLKTRSTVIPCLKAFAKIELGGNVLELHPLEKKKMPPSKDERRKSSSTNKDAKDKDEDSSGEKKSETEKSGDEETKDDSDDETNESKSEDKKDDKDKETPKKKSPSVTSSGSAKKDGEFKTPQAKGKDKNPNSAQRRQRDRGSRPGSGQKNRVGNGKSPGNRDGMPRNRDGRKSFGDNRAARRQAAAASRFSARAGGMRSPNFSGGGNRSFGAGMRRGSRGSGDRRMGGVVGGSEILAKREATKDMMVLQSQLNMAIKSQLAMLNQTKMAVEHAKRGASSIGLGSGLGVGGALGGSSYGLSHLSDAGSRRDTNDRYSGGRNRSRDNRAALGGGDAGNWGYGKRSAAQADLGDYGETSGYGRKRAGGMKGRGGGARGGRGGGGGYAQSRALAADRGAVGGYDEDPYSYSMRDQADDRYGGYGMTSRSFGGGAGLDGAGRASDYDNDSYGYGY